MTAGSKDRPESQESMYLPTLGDELEISVPKFMPYGGPLQGSNEKNLITSIQCISPHTIPCVVPAFIPSQIRLCIGGCFSFLD